MAIRYYSGVGDLVIDPFLGSGTSRMVAKKLGRDFIGIELDKHYFEIAKNRIAECERELNNNLTKKIK